MSLYNDYFAYLGDERTDIWIAEQTGIPRSTVGFVRRGERDLPEGYKGAARSVYQTETTRRLSETGFPHQQAIRFSKVSPAGQYTLEDEMTSLIEEIAEEHVVWRMYLAQQKGVLIDPDQAFEDSVEAITNAISSSHRSYEQIKEDYGK